MKREQPIPPEFQDAYLLDITGWSPDALDNQPESRIQMLVLFELVKAVHLFGGNLNL